MNFIPGMGLLASKASGGEDVLMAQKPSREGLEERIRQLEEELAERKRAEETLQIQKAYLEHLLDCAPEAIVLADRNHRITRTNAQFAHLFGYTPEEATGRICDDLIAPADKFNEASDITLRVGHGEAIRVETARCRKDGSPVIVELMAAPVHAGDEHIGDYVSYRDVTDRKRAEEALRESEARLRTLSDNLPGGLVYQIDSGEDGQHRRFSYISAGVEQLHGIAVAEALKDALTLYGQVVEEDRHRIAEREAFALANMTPFSAEARFRLPSGEIRWRLFTSAPRRLPNHHLVWDGIEIDITERKRAEEALKESEERYRTAIEYSNDGVAIVEGDKHIFVNQKFIEIFGYDRPEEVVGKSVSLCVHSDDKERVREINRKRQAGEPVFSRYEFKGVRKDGESVHIEVSATRTAYRGKSVSLAYLRDITDRKRVEDALRQSKATLQSVFWAAPVGICIMKNRVYQSANVFWCESFGYPEEDILGKNTRMLYESDEEYERVGRELYMGQQERGLASTETRLRRSDGVFRDVVLIAAPLRADDPAAGTVAVIQDITERKRAEEALRESEAKYRLLAENVTDVIWTADIGLNVTYVSPSVYRSRGFTPKEIMGMKLRDQLTPDSLALASRVLSEELAFEAREDKDVKRTRTIELEFLRKDRSTNWSEVNLTFIRDTEGKVVGILGVSRDISERKRVEEEKERLHSQLLQAQKMESVGRLAGGVAHDFNNMLQAILGHAEMASMTLEEDHFIQKDLKQIRDSAQRSATVVSQLLAFARKQTVSPKVLDLNNTVSAMLKMLQSLIGEDIDLAWVPGHQLRRVKIDPSQVDQILVNLVVNARDAIAGVGRITIETRNALLDESYCSEHAECVPGEYVQLAVSDNGAGMSEEVLGQLFEPFFTTKEPGKGTGLGLSTIYGIVKQNNGFIEVQSEPGNGASFRVYLPRFELEATELRAVAPSEPLQVGTETVLLVEDEEAIRDVAGTLLERLGYTVLSAKTPSRAIHLAEQHTGNIHLLITDVVMPEMNGRDLAERINGLRPGIKHLFMSGYSANVVAHHGILDKGVSFIQKPFSTKDIAAKIREALDKG
jgi:two-component system, cell cycle sensor histidine kinase and response regulator CckA